MNPRVEIFSVDEEGILLRSYSEEASFFFDGAWDDPDSPLMEALETFYCNKAPATVLCLGFETPLGVLRWESEWATPYGDEGYAEIGERLYLVMEDGDRWFDEWAYDALSRGNIPEGWNVIPRFP